jgi:hypothetical protein
MPLEHEGPGARPRADAGESTPYEILLGHIDEVIAEWREKVRLEPWARITPARLVDAFPEILPRIIRLAQSGSTHVDDELKRRITDDHGAFRRTDEIPLLAIAEEWAYLRHACAHVLQRRGVPPSAVSDAMTRLEVLVDDAVGYTLRGYYRDELDELRGRGLERRDSGVHDRRRGIPDRRGDGRSDGRSS